MMDLMMFPVTLLFIADGESLRFLTQLFEEHARVMQATAYHILGSHPDAQDAVSQAFVQLHKNISAIRQIPCNKLRPYLASTIRNVSITMLQRRQRERGRGGPMTEELEDRLAHPGEGTEDLALAGITAEAVIAAIGRLPEDKADIIRMSALDGLSDKEIAAMLGITPGGARSRLSRARAQLKELIKGEGHEEDEPSADKG